MTKTVVPRRLLALAMITALAGCSVVTERDVSALRDLPTSAAESASADAGEALKVALAQRGIRYRPGGNTPSEGFDCSGLVYFSFNSVGIRLPRSSQDMFHATRRIDKAELRPGDLVFFRQRSSRITHVGIYAGNGQFVHAPTKGKDVELTSLEDPYWKKRFAGAGRVETGSPTLASN
ncbi:MAG: C40 family peptidase [Gammaproteobacteria bacterium]|nr:C40 family peptidase [Gammaproteobacteria bacterium]